MSRRTIIKKLIPVRLFRDVEPYGHLAEAMLVETRGGFPAKDLKVIGVTGTDGKTSTSSLIAEMLRSNGYKVAMMTTISIDYGDGKGIQPNPTRLTTYSVGYLVKALKKIKANGVEYLVLETTSHALAQHRVWGIPYSVAVMTNIRHEHLDYHRTFERYRAAKLRLFKLADANKKGLRAGVVNAEDPSAELFVGAIENPVTYGVKKGDLQAKNVDLKASGSTYTAVIGDDKYDIVCHLPGSFNISNSLAAVAVGRILGLDRRAIEKGIASLKSVEGRMTSVKEGQDFEVIVDYAHTPDSFEKIFTEVRPMVKNRLIVLFGSAGRRDEEKRAQQGEVAGRLCDVVIVTEEDDRDIDGQEILNEIASGAEKAEKVRDKDLFLVHDREEAVKYAVNMAQPGDVIMMLGKGHEKSILYSGPQAAELRHLQQDDTDTRRVLKRDYDEVTEARKAIKASLKR